MARRFNLAGAAGTIGCYKDRKLAIDISANDYEDPKGFTAQVNKAGDVTYRTLLGDADQTETLSAGDYIGGVTPVAVVAVRANATIATINVNHF